LPGGRANYFPDVCKPSNHIIGMKQILLFGAGKSATALIEYFLVNALAENWQLTVVDANLELAKEKMGDSSHGIALSFDILDDKRRKEVISQAHIVISLLPPALHFLIAKDCLQANKNLLTASYVDDQLKAMKTDIEAAGLLFLCEMGLDPGIDHMSAKKMIDDIQQEGGKITSFLSHCGGLVAPESDDNPWHYKISWNPRNVVMAGKAGAIFRQDGEIREMEYETLFAEKRYVSVPGSEPLCWYRNIYPHNLTPPGFHLWMEKPDRFKADRRRKNLPDRRKKSTSVF
jgi:saccharopine dehydrogenase-like NADP-dependent oxidoreductase